MGIKWLAFFQPDSFLGQSDDVCKYRQDINGTTCAIVNATISIGYTYTNEEDSEVNLSDFSLISCHVFTLMLTHTSLSLSLSLSLSPISRSRVLIMSLAQLNLFKGFHVQVLPV